MTIMGYMSKNKTSLATTIDYELADQMKKASEKNNTIQDFIDDFICQFISPQTKKAYINDLIFFFNFLKKGNVFISSPSQIEGHHFQFYRDFLIQKKYSSATINRKLVAIRSFIKWAMASKLLDHNPLDVVKLPKVQTKDPTLAFDDHEVIQMINAPDLSTRKGHMHKVVITLLFSLGLRRSELVHIKIKDIYKERNHFVVRIQGKGDKPRHLPLTTNILNILDDYLNHLKNIGLTIEEEDYLIQTCAKFKNNRPVDGSTIYRIINKYAKLCNITKRVSPHSCRATAISHLLDTQNTPIRDVAIFAGHSKITTTERYDKRRDGLDNSAAYDIDYGCDD